MNISEDFTRRVADDRFCAEVRQAVEEGNTAALERLGMRGFGRYAGRLAELIEESVRLGVDPDDLGFETLINELASPARYAHHLVNESGTAIQTALDSRNGLRIKPAEPEFESGRFGAIVSEAAHSESENAADNLAVQIGTMTKDAGNRFMEVNAEQRDRAGFKVTVRRTGGADCCPWCSARTGSWELKNAPDGVFGCHDNCKCMVDYTNSAGTVRGKAVGRKWNFAEIPYEPPHVMTHEEAREKGGFDEPKRLTEAPKRGTMYSDSDSEYKPVSPEAYSRITPLDVFGDQRDHLIVEAMRDVLNKVDGKEPGTEWLALYDYQTMNFIDGVLSEIGAGDVEPLDHGEAYISIHNHASEETFSFQDIYKFQEFKNCKAIFVVGNNGNCYALAKGKEYDDTGLFMKIIKRAKGFEPYTDDTEERFIEECKKYGVKYYERRY